MKRPSRGVILLWSVGAVFLLTGASLATGAGNEPTAEAPTSGALHAAAPMGIAEAPALISPAPSVHQISSIGRSLDTPFLERARSLVLVMGANSGTVLCHSIDAGPFPT